MNNGEGKYLFVEKTKKGRRKMRKIFGEGEYLVHGGEEDRRRKKRNHLDEEN